MRGAQMLRSAITLVAVGVTMQLGAGQPAVHSFDNSEPGKLPPGFQIAAMRQPNPGVWRAQRADSNGALVHLADASASGFALALAPDPPVRDVTASVRLRFRDGTRAGGLVWRYADPGNFYAVILDLRRNALSLSRVSAGNRVFLEFEDDLELDPAAWHTLRIDHREDRIAVSLGGIRVFDERDRRTDRPNTPGLTGVVAGGGAEVWFDELRIREHQARRDNERHAPGRPRPGESWSRDDARVDRRR